MVEYGFEFTLSFVPATNVPFSINTLVIIFVEAEAAMKTEVTLGQLPVPRSKTIHIGRVGSSPS